MNEIITSLRADGSKSLRILVVDDDKLLIRTVINMLERRLSMLGFLDVGIIECSNGIEAIEAFTSSPLEIDIILTDVRMPGIDGVDTVNLIREKFPEHKAVVIFMSGHLDRRDQQDLAAAGMFCFLQKAFTLDQLTTAILNAIVFHNTQGIVFYKAPPLQSIT